jgi:hypothetical protein
MDANMDHGRLLDAKRKLDRKQNAIGTILVGMDYNRRFSSRKQSHLRIMVDQSNTGQYP